MAFRPLATGKPKRARKSNWMKGFRLSERVDDIDICTRDTVARIRSYINKRVYK